MWTRPQFREENRSVGFLVFVYSAHEPFRRSAGEQVKPLSGDARSVGEMRSAVFPSEPNVHVQRGSERQPKGL